MANAHVANMLINTVSWTHSTARTAEPATTVTFTRPFGPLTVSS